MDLSTALNLRTYYNPLSNIMWYDRFDNGLSGWNNYSSNPGTVYTTYMPNETDGDHSLTTAGPTGGKVMAVDTGTGKYFTNNIIMTPISNIRGNYYY